MPKPSEVVAAINVLIRECDDLRRRIVVKEEVRAWDYRVIVARKPMDPEGVWAPAEVVLGAAPARAGGGRGGRADGRSFLGEVLPPMFDVVEAPVVRKSKDVLGKVKYNIGIEPIEDIFNDKIDYSMLREETHAPWSFPTRIYLL